MTRYSRRVSFWYRSMPYWIFTGAYPAACPCQCPHSGLDLIQASPVLMLEGLRVKWFDWLLPQVSTSIAQQRMVS